MDTRVAQPFRCRRCGVEGAGVYSRGCGACRRRAHRAEQQRARRTGTRAARIVIDGERAAELRHLIDALPDDLVQFRERDPGDYVMATYRLLLLLRQVLAGE